MSKLAAAGIFLGVFGGLFCSPGLMPFAQAAEVVSVFPTGSVKQVQQITVRFSTDMVPMGDPRSHQDPFKIACHGKDETKPVVLPAATARWIDNKNWSYDFAKPLGSGIKCTLTNTVENDLKGAKITALKEYSFTTGGPAILSVYPRYGSIEPDQFFVLETEGAMDMKSVETHAFFESQKLMSRIGVRVVQGADRETVIRAAIKSQWNLAKYRPLIESKKSIAAIREFDSLLVLAAKNRFSEDSTVVLHWPKGVLSTSQVPVEEPQTFQFQVIPPFEAKFTCERVNPERPCNPVLNMRVEFSRLVDGKLLSKVKLVGPNGQSWSPVEFDKTVQAARGRGNADFIDALTFSAPFPDQATFKIALPVIKDELGRTLANQAKFPLEVKTDEFTPLVKFAAPFGVLERYADPILPVSLRNVEKILPGMKESVLGKSVVIDSKSDPAKILDLYRRVLRKDGEYQHRNRALLAGEQAKTFQLPKPGGERDFELVGIPLKEPGLHIVELSSPRLGQALLDKPTMYVASGALVTNLAVHFKKGRESSAVWVTTLDKAQPVAGADVSLVTFDGTAIAEGKTDASGILRIANVNYPCAWDQERTYESHQGDDYVDKCEVFAFAKHGDDMSFVSNRWSRGIEEYRFNLASEYLDANWGPIVAHAVLDRALIQAGETLHFKTFLREYTAKGFNPFTPKRVPKRVLIVHRGSGKTFSQPFQFDPKTGTAVGEFVVPKDATLGLYEIFLSMKSQATKATSENGNESDEGESFDWQAKSVGNFIVAEYRLPVMESTVKIQGSRLVRPKDVKVDVSAQYLSGGPARGLKIKIRSSLTPASFVPDFPGAKEYAFFSRELKSGVDESGNENKVEADLGYVYNENLALSESGGAVATVKEIPSIFTMRSLVVEMEYRDPNGEVKTGRSESLVFPSSTVIGLKSDSWFAKAGSAVAAGIVVNTEGQRLPGQRYVVDAFRREYITHRKRLVGGFYSYDSSSKTTRIGKVCEGKTDAQGEFRCDAKNLPSGSVTLQARTTDEKGRTTLASIGMSIYEEGDYSWWTPSDSDRIDLLPEKSSYEPSETAKFVLRSPFPVSTVLVTVEREGVLDAFVRTVSRDNPIIEVPLKGNFAPNVFVSALALRGRVGDPKPTALIDLAKPAMKLGMTEIKVGWKAHELKVSVTSDKKKYRTREKAIAKIQVTRADGAPFVTEGSEVAIAVVDEAVAQLRKNWSLDLLSGMMRQRPLAVDTASAQNQVIGKRHFGSKAKPPGGGGGVGGPENRELFDPLLLWLPRVKLDAKGEATIAIPLNDSMTSFRINAVAQSGVGFFGSGSTLIESSKDLLMYSGFAPVVRDGDNIKNKLTIRNTTGKMMKVEVAIKSPQIAPSKLFPPTIPIFELKPSEAKILEIPVTVPGGIKHIEYVVVAKDKLAGSTDSLKVETRVQESVPVQVLQATLFQLDKSYSIPVQQPKDAVANRGGLSVEARSTLLTGLSGVKAYMEDYPYSCLEQKISKAVVLEDAPKMKEVLRDLPSYLDQHGLLKFFSSAKCGSHLLTRYVLSIVQANGYEVPTETRDRTLAGLAAWLNGQTSCPKWWDTFTQNKYRDQERILVMEALSRYDRFEPEWLKTISITPNLWKTTTVVALYRLAEREAAMPDRIALMKQAENILRSRVNYQGSLMNLRGDLDWEAAWALFASSDQEALEVFSIAIDAPSWSEDVGRVARGVTARQRKGNWDTTTANAWGVTELRRFSRKFEKEKVSGVTSVKSAGVDYSLNWARNSSGEKTQLPWPTSSEVKPVSVGFTHKGSGKPWMLLQTRSAIPLKAPFDMGYTITRKVTRVSEDAAASVTTPSSWKVGDVANIELTIKAKYDHPWVVIRDPIPAGASHLGTGLAGESNLLDRAPKTRPTVGQVNFWPSEFDEKTQSHFISYAPFVMKGTYRTNYRIRLNSAGQLKMPPTHVEAMYSPETFGDSPIATWTIAP